MKIVFATWPTAEYQRRRLTEEGGNNRLLSYYFMATEDPDLLKRYVSNNFEVRSVRRQQGWGKDSYLRRRRLGVLAHAKQGEPCA